MCDEGSIDYERCKDDELLNDSRVRKYRLRNMATSI